MKKIFSCSIFLLIIFIVMPDQKIYSQNPVDPNLIQSGKNILNYFSSIYGQKTITAVANNQTHWTDTIFECTGKYPAIIGEDICGWNATKFSQLYIVNIQNSINRCINYWNNRHGIVQIQFHWPNPLTTGGQFPDSQEDITQAQWNNIVTPGTSEYNIMISELDWHLNYLQQLTDLNIPVLWRPLHEIDGGWFWWTNQNNPAQTAQLWRIIYNHMVNVRGMHNLIWVWSSSEINPFQYDANYRRQFYPGDQYVDITGVDLYQWDVNTGLRTFWNGTASYKDFFNIIQAVAPSKMIALSEGQALPNGDQSQNNNANFARWLYALPWWAYSCTYSNVSDYAHNYYISADELPSFTGGGGTPSGTIEAENWTAQSGGSNASAQPGYTGSGYYDMGNNGSYGEWNNVNVSPAGNRTLTFRYANGGTTNRSCALTVNGVAGGTNNFASTGSWTTWQTITFTNIPMNAGNNTVRLTVNSTNGGPNVDNFIVSGGDTQAPSIPTGLVSSSIMQTSFTLSWNASTDNIGVTGYDVYQNGTLKGSTTGTTSFAVTGLSAATTYSMTVRAKDAAGNISAASSALNVTTASSSFNLTIQAENYTTQSGGANSTAQTGYTGTGYYDMGGNTTWVEYVFAVPSAGAYTVSIRYANGGTTNRTCNVTTNGSSVSNNFAPTGSWTTWIETSSSKNLNAGNNTIRITATTVNGGANIDRLIISSGSGARIAGGANPITIKDLPDSESKTILYPNPASQTVRLSGIRSSTLIKIFSMGTGQLVKKVLTTNGIIDISGLSKGIYMVEVNSKTLKLIKQ